mgnify:FL=1
MLTKIYYIKLLINFKFHYFYNNMKDKINKFLEVEDRVFRAPYNFLKEKGIIDKVKEIKTRFVEIYAKDEEIPYGGNQMFFGDD